MINFAKRIILIGGTEYAGEMKKSIFSVMNYLLPLQNVLSMHCSANVGPEGDVALFFGLSGTGKTTFSADPKRRLIGDDEHAWSITASLTLKAVVMRNASTFLKRKSLRFGMPFASVPYWKMSIWMPKRAPSIMTAKNTENTRAAYPIEHIPGAVIPSIAGHPKTILFLTADAFGVLPPISKLTKEQAMYHFLSGYTSKLAGTERGVTEPEATFSTCFGAPFLPLAPKVYANMLGEKMEEHQTEVYLVNTGWTGGPYGVGERMNLQYTRAMVSAALQGQFEHVNFVQDPVFGLHVPTECPDVPSDILQPRGTWQNAEEYDKKAHELAERFARNFEKFADVPEAVKQAGPRYE